MIQITVPRSTGHSSVYTLYEPGDAIPEHVVLADSVYTAKSGQYVRDANGRLVPCLKVLKFTRKRYPRAGQQEHYVIFPGFCYITGCGKPFSYPVTKEHKPASISMRTELFAQQLSNGADIWHAAARAWPKLHRAALRTKILSTFRKPAFIMMFIKESNFVESLKMKLAERGVDEDVIADHIAEAILNSKDKATGKTLNPSSQLRMWAYNMAMQAIKEPEKRREARGGLLGALIQDTTEKVMTQIDQGTAPQAMLVAAQDDDSTYVLAALRTDPGVEEIPSTLRIGT